MSLRYSADFRRSRLVFFFSVRPQTSSYMYHFVLQILIGLRGTQRSQVRVVAFARNFFEHLLKRTKLKGPLFRFFWTLCDFFRIFCLKRVPLQVSNFLIFCSNVMCQKTQRVSPFQVFRHYETVSKFSFFVSFRKFFCLLRVPPFTILKTLRCLSLRYSGDFRRSRLVICLVIYLHEAYKDTMQSAVE